jgi:hypothetical protein
MDSGEEQDRRARVCACSVPGRAPAWCWAAGERPLLLLGAQSAGGAPALLTNRERREGEDTDVHCCQGTRPKASARSAFWSARRKVCARPPPYASGTARTEEHAEKKGVHKIEPNSTKSKELAPKLCTGKIQLVATNLSPRNYRPKLRKTQIETKKRPPKRK